jgi:cobalt transporter subunit CbtB
MTGTHDTVYGRIEGSPATPTQLVAGLALAVALGVGLGFLQEPLVHDAMHNVRHAAGVVCH